jgi:predicted nucleic acid-binding protein
MNVVVDTPVWSLSLRRKAKELNSKEQQLTEVLAQVIRENRVQLLGLVRQELLSGMREPTEFDRLRDSLRAFPEPRLQSEDYEEAARMSNQCRGHGIAGSGIDFLICSTAWRRNWIIFTTDADFMRYAKVLPIQLKLTP